MIRIGFAKVSLRESIFQLFHSIVCPSFTGLFSNYRLTLTITMIERMIIDAKN